MKLNPLVTVAERRTIDKLRSIMDNVRHPLHTVIHSQRSLISQRLRLPKSAWSAGSLRERDYTFFWQGKPPGETREYGVGFAVKNMLLGALIPPTGGSERILTLGDLSTCALEEFYPLLPQCCSAQQYWDGLRDTIHRSALAVFGKKLRRSNDWFEANASVLTPILEQKRIALTNYKCTPNDKTLRALRSSRKILQQTSRRCANSYWLQLCSNIQSAADSGNAKGMHNGIKKVLGPTHHKIAPLKSALGETITDRSKQLDRWVEHYSVLYASDNTVPDAAFCYVERQPVMEELDMEPTTEELSKAIDSLTCGKAPGSDGITTEVLKCGKPAVLDKLHKLLCQCWCEGTVPHDMRDSTIITLYKNKGDRSDCNNYRGISLLSTTGKLFARVVLNRLQVLAEKIYPESQAGFRVGRSTTDDLLFETAAGEVQRAEKATLHGLY
ncbi:hypothetical protein D4764_16G0000160 [Takifugu flavidus]|uniref:Uncharacterized protein n=1 Tax=Takifugu flavidus TaxID=433684 RepID=A0A5C6NXX9_9TELE|nr:hypothetical protein D4764_16G0000160 [Takifugu flavidus]